MDFIKKFSINKFFLTFILFSILSLNIFFYKDSIYTKKVESFVLDVYVFLSKPASWYNNILTIKEENKILSQELVQLSLMNSKLVNYESENRHLKEMLKFKEAYKHLSLLPANIVNSNLSISSKSYIINVGKNDNVVRNLCVIDAYGNLVGKIINVGNNNSNVQLLTDKNFSISIKVADNLSIAQFKPTYWNYGILEGVLKTLEIKKGDIIYTSGISEIYPPDIAIAKVASKIKKQNKLFQDVAVEILTDINNLYYVFVIQ